MQSDNGWRRKILTAETSGGLEAANDCETISLRHSQIKNGQMPFRFKIS